MVSGGMEDEEKTGEAVLVRLMGITDARENA